MIYVSLLEECQDCYLTQTSCPVKQNSDRYNSFEFLICSTFLLNEIKQGCKIGKAKVKKKWMSPVQRILENIQRDWKMGSRSSCLLELCRQAKLQVRDSGNSQLYYTSPVTQVSSRAGKIKVYIVDGDQFHCNRVFTFNVCYERRCFVMYTFFDFRLRSFLPLNKLIQVRKDGLNHHRPAK